MLKHSPRWMLYPRLLVARKGLRLRVIPFIPKKLKRNPLVPSFSGLVAIHVNILFSFQLGANFAK